MASSTELYGSVFIILSVLIGHSFSASKLVFQATPDEIHPVLTTTLNLRCAVEHSSTRTVQHPTAFVRRQLHGPDTAVSTTPVPPGDTILSITLYRLDEDSGTLQRVAFVSAYDPPTTSLGVGTFATVDGDTSRSPVATEDAFLDLAWQYPYTNEAGNYTCDVSGLDSNLHPFTLQQSLLVTMAELDIHDLMVHVIENDNDTTQLLASHADLQNVTLSLQESVSELQSDLAQLQQQSQNNSQVLQDIQALYQQYPPLNIQSGHLGLCGDTTIAFPVPFNNTPTVVLSVTSVEHWHGGNAGNHFYYDVSATSITQYGFNLLCDAEDTHLVGFEVSWLAI